jgi:hypothetical protein
VFETDIPLLRVGQAVDVLVEALPNERVRATVTYLAFALDPSTRTLDARIEVPNKEMKLRPGMFATAVILAPAVPGEAGEHRTSNTEHRTSNENAAILQTALEPYLKSSDLLAHDKIDGVGDLLGKTVKLLEPVAADAKYKEAYGRLAAAVKEVPGEEIGALRETFKRVSLALIDIGKAIGQPPEAPLVQVYICPMRDKPYWLQVSGPTANPYMGQRMFDCGGPVEPLPRAKTTPAAGGAGGDEKAYVLAIPRSAVIDTGTRRVVFVQSGPGVFDARQVTLGAMSSDDFYPVLSGLKEGDEVVTTGAFLLDSENRLNPAAPPSDDGGNRELLKPAAPAHVH